MSDRPGSVPSLPGTKTVFGDQGISGLVIIGAFVGMALIVSGLKNAPVAEVVRAMLQGRPPESGPSQLPGRVGGSGSFGIASGVSAPGGSATGSAVAAQALRYVGVPYRFGYHTPAAWDCSGFVTWVLHHDFGIDLPNNTHTVTGQFMVWSGAVTVPRNQCAAGDLVCWWGHIGIATGRDTMVNAPGIGIRTREQSIGFGAVIRRPLAYSTPVESHGPKAGGD